VLVMVFIAALFFMLVDWILSNLVQVVLGIGA
jgi:preprotein translocase subunit SecE